MKKSLTILFAALAITGTAQAQVSVGAKAGLNMANIGGYTDASFTGFGYSQSYKNKPIFGFHAGGYAEFKISDAFSFQPEVLFSMKGYKEEVKQEFDNGNHNNVTNTVSVSYIDIPVQARINLKNGIHFLGGPYIGILAAAKTTSKTDQKVGNVTSTNENSSTEKDVYKGMDAGIYLGGGYQLENGLNFGLRWCGGFSSIYDGGSRGNNSVVQFSVGYAFIK